MKLLIRPLFMTRSVLYKKLNMSASLFDKNLNPNNTMKHVKQAHTTIDTAEVQKHVDLVNIWWDKNGVMGPLQRMNLIRVPFIRDGLVQCGPNERTTTPLSGKTILDVGCGGGILSEGLARLGAQVTGVDAAKDLIEVAKDHCKLDPKLENNKPLYICTSIEEHAEGHKNHYDAVVASEIIEHVTNKELFVKSCVDTLKPGGRIFFTCPSRTRLSQFLGIFVAEYILKLIPRGTHEYEKFTTPNELTFLLERNNCHVEIIHGAIYNPITSKWQIINSDKVLFMLQAVKII